MTKYYLGIEIAGEQLKIAAFKKSGKGFSSFKLDRLLLSHDREKDSQLLKEWVNNTFPKESKINAVLSIPESTLFLKEVVLPKLKKEQIKEALYWEVASFVPFPKDDLILDWKLLKKDKDGLKVLAICARESVVGGISSLLDKLGINVISIEPSSMSFIRATRDDFERTTLLMSVEQKETNLSVLHNRAPTFTTSISTPIIPEENAKRKLSKKVIDDLASQAFKTIEYWEEKNSEKVGQVVITGDIAEKYYGLANSINKKAKIPALMATMKTFSNLNLTKVAKSTQLRYLIAIGAFYRFVAGLEGVNLLPKIKKEEVEKKSNLRKLQRSSFLLFLANFSLAALFLISYLILTFWNRSLHKIEAEKEALVKNHQAQVLIPKVRSTNEKAEIIDNLIRLQKDTGVRLETISDSTPKSVRLTSIDFGQLEREEWEIEGIGSRNDILAFYDKLKDSDAKEVSMPYSNFSKETDNEFEIKITW